MSKDSKIEFQKLEGHLFIDSIMESIWSIDLNYNLIAFNDFFKKRNLKSSGFRAKKGAFIKNINPEHFDTFWKAEYDKVFLGKSKNLEYLSPDQKYFEIKLSPIILDNTVVGLTAYSNDISERKMIENQIEESEEKYSTLVENSNDGIIVHRDGKIIFANQIVKKEVGYKVDEVLGKNMIDFIAPDFRELVFQTSADRHSGKKVTQIYQINLIGKDGADLPVEINSSIINYDGEKATLVFVRNISERKIIEEKLKYSEERFELAMKGANEGLWDWDVANNTVYFSPQYKKMLGYNDDEIENKFESWENLLHKDDLEIATQTIDNFFKDGKENFKAEFRMKHKNGTYRNILSKAYCIRSASGDPIRIVGTHIDITELRLAEHELMESEEKFKEIFEKSSDALSIIKNGVFIDCNFAACKMLGYSTKKEFLDLNTHPSKLSPKVQPDGSDSFHKAEEYLKAAYEKGSQLFEWVHTRKNGENFPVEVLLSVISNEPDNKILSCVWRDITERKKAEEEQAKYRTQLEEENVYLKNEIALSFNYEDIVYSSEEISDVLTQVEQVSNTNATVLILGETGTGKELIAKALHNTSDRKNHSLIRVNCAAIPSELIESELFGHIKGSFTGAIKNRIGKFELANNGTLFLDEIGEIPLLLQSKLLRAIQEGEIDPIGSSETRKLDVRIIAATNKDLKKETEEKRFREDLFFRLNVFPITIPPLRDRIDDIPVLIDHFVNKYCLKHRKEIKYISDVTLQQMKSYSWPGNIRELENLIERAVIISSKDLLLIREFESSAQNKIAIKKFSNTLEEIQRNHIIKILNETQWKIGGKEGAAMILDIKPSTLRDRMKKLSIKRS